MKSQRRYFAFREDAIDWLVKKDFYYADFFGWCHAEKFAAGLEFLPDRRNPWALCVYKSAVPPKKVG